MLKDYNKYLDYKEDKLFLENVDLEELAKEFGTPLYVYSASYIKDKAKAYKEAFEDTDFHYALKANGNLSIVKLLKNEGFGADIVSGGELRKAIKAGIEPSQIVYAGVGKTIQELRAAVEAEIKMFNVESSMELDILNDIAKNLGKKANVAIRVNPDVDPKTHPYISTGMKKSKFGVDIKTAYKEYQYAKSLKHLNVIGIHCHIGSQLLDVSPYIEASEKVRELYDKLVKDGFDIKYIDMGGGLGIKYKPEEQEPHPKDLKEALYPAFKDIKARLCLEPGRSMVGNAGILITEVQFLKDKGHKHFVIVDAGMNDLIRPSIYGAYHHIVPTHNKYKEDFIKTDIVGPICETGDFLAQDREIHKVDRGDYLAVLSAGAYGFSMSSHYNIRPRSAEVLVENGKYRLIRSRETYDYIDYDEAIL
jgi:diaminopimelate decarboxylase